MFFSRYSLPIFRRTSLAHNSSSTLLGGCNRFMQVKTSDRHDYDYFHFLTDSIPKRKATRFLFCLLPMCGNPFPFPSPPTLHPPNCLPLAVRNEATRASTCRAMPACSLKSFHIIEIACKCLLLENQRKEEGGVGQTQSRLKTRQHVDGDQALLPFSRTFWNNFRGLFRLFCLLVGLA